MLNRVRVKAMSCDKRVAIQRTVSKAVSILIFFCNLLYYNRRCHEDTENGMAAIEECPGSVCP